MSDIIANAKRLLEDTTPGSWSFQPWSKYTGPNGDYEESTLFDSDGETLCHGLPDSEGELIAAAPEMAQALAEETWEYAVQIERSDGWEYTRKPWESRWLQNYDAQLKHVQRGFPGEKNPHHASPRITSGGNQ